MDKEKFLLEYLLYDANPRDDDELLDILEMNGYTILDSPGGDVCIFEADKQPVRTLCRKLEELFGEFCIIFVLVRMEDESNAVGSAGIRRNVCRPKGIHRACW